MASDNGANGGFLLSFSTYLAETGANIRRITTISSRPKFHFANKADWCVSVCA